jgi:SepF-like predicted cell division protein (DUF552 family)
VTNKLLSTFAATYGGDVAQLVDNNLIITNKFKKKLNLK